MSDTLPASIVFFMRKLVLSFALFSTLYLLSSKAILAGVVCQPIYGGGVVCPPVANLVVNKTVMHPQSGVFVENLGLNDPKFQAEQVVTFKVTVTNAGTQAFSKVTVKDVLPQFVSFGTGPGSFDTNTRTLTIDAGGLNPNETKTFTFTTRVVPQNQLPSDQATVCVVNQVTATADSQTAQDNAQACIEKQVLGAPETKGGLRVFPPPQVRVTPPTGPEALALVALLPTGIAGYLLRRKSSKDMHPRKERG